jgi:hypothetical protein
MTPTKSIGGCLDLGTRSGINELGLWAIALANATAELLAG